MAKRQTISTRWQTWALKEPVWAYTCLFCFGLVFMGLMMHLGILSGFWRTFGLYAIIIGDIGCLGITWFRKQFWWFGTFIGITAVIIGAEIASYFFGSQKI